MKVISILLFSLFISTSFVHADQKDRIIVCENGLEMFGWNLDFIAHANQSIEISTPFLGGKIARALLTAIDQRMQERQELQVYMLFAPMFLEDRDSSQLQLLLRKYPTRFHYVVTGEAVVDATAITIGNHAKIFLVDEHYYAVGGTNLDEGLCTDGKYTPPRKPKDRIAGVLLPAGARDGDVVAQGPLAKQLRQTFYKLYAVWEDYARSKRIIKDPEHFAKKNGYFALNEGIEKPYAPLFEESSRVIEVDQIEMIFSGYVHAPNNPITARYEKLLHEAKKRVVVGNLYFNPPAKIFNAFKALVNRGVELKLIDNGIYQGVSPDYTSNFCWVNRINYVPMLYGREFRFWESKTAASMAVKKVKIYEYYVNDVVYHKKAMVIDDRFFVVGSYNLGTKSDVSDFELVLVIESEKVVEEAMKIFETDISLSKEVDAPTARAWYFDPWTAYLGGTQKLFNGIM